MRWWDSNLCQELLKPLTLSIFVMYLNSDSPDNIFINLANVRGPPPTWAWSVSVPVSPDPTQSHPPTWVLPVSVPAPQFSSLIACCYPWLLMSVPLAPPPPLFFLLYFRQSWPKLFLCHLLMTPCVPTVSTPLVSILVNVQTMWEKRSMYVQYFQYQSVCTWIHDLIVFTN